MISTRERLLRLLIDTKAFKSSPTPIFPLASGAMSNFYIDCKLGMSHPEARQIVGEMMLDLIESPVGAVGGLLIGAYPIAIAVSDAAYKRTGQDLRAFAVRKEPKPHGTKKLIEGDVEGVDRVLIVEDVITSGGSTIEAIRKCRERLYDLHIKDIDSTAPDGHTVEAGRGVLDLPAILRALLDIGYSHLLSFEYEKDEDDPLPGLAESVGYVKGLLGGTPR
jgi:orotate phosphoribosyltransferase